MTNRPSLDGATASVAENLAHTATLTEVFPKAPNYRDAIRRKCIDCCIGDRSEVARCGITSCALWPFRFGSNPLRQAPDTETP